MPGDRILIRDLLVRGILGVNDTERRIKQDILVNLALEADVAGAARSDRLDHSVNYRTIAKRVIAHIESSSRFTVEALAEDIARLCLSMPGVQHVTVRVEKPGAVRFARSVGVEIKRGQEDLG